MTLKATGKPELAVAESAIGATPTVTGEVGAVNVIVCEACTLVRETDELTALLFALPL
jgi:hypothetical protein